MTRPASWVLGAFAFCLLAILNCGGYRYGISDQAFYIPAILQHLDPSLFPRDRWLMHAQDRFMLFDDGMAAAARMTGISVPVLFLAVYLAGLALLFAGIVLWGRTWYRSWWAVAALAVMFTLHHRITRTGVNALEGYLHPRMLAFAVGVCAVALFLRGRSLWALTLAVGAGLLHPTTSLWFVLWIVVAALVSEPRLRRPLVAVGALGAAAALWLVWKGPLRDRLVVMDTPWTTVLAGKDYVFASDWNASFWFVNLAYLAVILAIYRYRRALGQTLPREGGLVCGAAALVVIFLLAWPLIAARVALAVQLQVSRVFWMLDFLTTVYLVWLGVEAPLSRRGNGAIRKSVVAIMAALAIIRGGYVMGIERAGAPLVRLGLPDDEWTDVMAWAARTPAATHLLADPGHAWKYGSSVRVAGQRDVYLEEVKDAALAMYSPEVAMRVWQRGKDMGNFDELTPEKARSLAVQYDLDYLIADRPMALPVIYRNRRFGVYALAGDEPTGR